MAAEATRGVPADAVGNSGRTSNFSVCQCVAVNDIFRERESKTESNGAKTVATADTQARLKM
jgi:hypothetical protein